MKIVFQNVILLLSFVTYNYYFCLAENSENSIRVGVFFNEDQLTTPLNWNVLQENLDEEINFTPPEEIKTVSDKDIFDAIKKLCDFVASSNERIAGIFGPNQLLTSETLQSLSVHLNIPYFVTTWQPPENKIDYTNVFNLYPDSVLLSKAFARIIDSFDWSGYAILYEHEDGLLKLQEVLKLQQYRDDYNKNEVMIQKLSSGWDNRHVLKSIRNSSTPNKIILDCHVDRIMTILEQAMEVKLLSDVSTSFFLTSLDAHTLDFSFLRTLANITTVRLFDPKLMNFQTIVTNYFPDIEPTKMRVETALIYDAMVLITEATNRLKSKVEEITPKELWCSSTGKYSDDLNITHFMRQVEVTDTLTGPFTLENGRRESFKLEVIETTQPERPVGLWNSEYPDTVQLTRNATEREAEFLKRMESYNFIVTSRIGPPYLYENADKEAFGNARYYGYSMDLIKEVAKIMNISFEFRITKDNSYANLAVDLIERRADLAICDFTITPQRREVIDFSMPFMNLGIGILHKKGNSQKTNNMYAFMRPISWKVWGYIWSLMLILSIILCIVARLSPGEWENPKPWDPESKEEENIWSVKNFLWLALGSITNQGCDILPKSVSARVMAGFFWLFSLIITSSYTANLTAFLTSDKKDVTIDNVEELAAQSRIKYGLVATGSTEAFFSSSNNSLYQKMWNTMKNEKPSVFEKDNERGVERVRGTKNSLYAFFMESTGIEYELAKYCELRKIGDLLDSKSYGIGMPMNAVYRHWVNAAILRLQETGVLIQLKTKWWTRDRKGDPCPTKSVESTDALTLSNVGGIFIVLCVGIGLAYAIAIIEFLWHVGRLAAEEHLSYMETLKCEVKFACNIFTKMKRAKPLPSESSSSKSDIDQDKFSIALSVFGKSASMLNVNAETDLGARKRRRSPSNTTSRNALHE